MDQNTNTPANPEPLPQEPVAAPPPRRRPLAIIIMALVTIALVFEIAARIWLAYGKNVPMGRPDAVITSYYPMMRKALGTKIGGRDGHFDVLILSGSAFFDYYGGPALMLQRSLEKAGYENVRIWNMARPAHTTRDSLIKYRWLEDKHFDWVIVYHGINDLRANNVPDDEYKDDYSHMAWYAEINAVASRPFTFPRSDLAAPLMWNYMRQKIRKTSGQSEIDYDKPPSDEAMEFGAKIKTAEAFRDNLKDIVDISKERDDWMTLVTYGFYLDPKYTKARMEHDIQVKTGKIKEPLELSYATTSYCDQAQPCEIWGKPENLVAGIKAHNEQTSQVANSRKRRVGLVDFAGKVPQQGKYFIDICHLSPAGVDLLTSSVMAAVPPLRSKAARARVDAAKAGAGVTTSTAAAVQATTSTATAQPAGATTSPLTKK